jgi:hypothetical protein
MPVILETCQQYSGNIPLILWKHASNTLETCQQYSGNMPAIFWKHASNTLETCQQYSGNMPAILWKHASNTLEIYQLEVKQMIIIITSTSKKNTGIILEFKKK